MSNEIKNEKKRAEPMSMYHMYAKLFAHVAKAVIDQYGEDAREAIKKGVRAFGEERGRNIANRAAAAGETNEIENFLANYDMSRSELFEYTTINTGKQIEQNYSKCVFADQWQKDGMQEYGILYCDTIDPAIARGFNENLEVVHDKHLFQDGICHFCFNMKKT